MGDNGLSLLGNDKSLPVSLKYNDCRRSDCELFVLDDSLFGFKAKVFVGDTPGESDGDDAEWLIWCGLFWLSSLMLFHATLEGPDGIDRSK